MTVQASVQSDTERYERAIKRRKVMRDEDVEVDDYEADESENDNNESSSVAVQTEVTFGLGLDIATPQGLHTYQETIEELQSELEG